MNNHTEQIIPWQPSCDFCNEPAKYDARMLRGSWAYMCNAHFEEHGIKLGLGYGQRLIFQAPGKGEDTE